MSRLLRLQYRLAFSSGMFLSLMGAILILVGFFLPLAFNHSMAGAGNGQTQWDMVTSGYVWLLAPEHHRYIDSTINHLSFIFMLALTVLSAIPFLNALSSLMMSLTAILR